jgi:hypothetical protein
MPLHPYLRDNRVSRPRDLVVRTVGLAISAVLTTTDKARGLPSKCSRTVRVDFHRKWPKALPLDVSMLSPCCISRQDPADICA